MNTNHTFADALASLLADKPGEEDQVAGQEISREIWDVGGFYPSVYARWPNAFAFVSSPFLVLHDASGQFRVWFPTNDDLFAKDWRIHPLAIFISSPAHAPTAK